MTSKNERSIAQTLQPDDLTNVTSTTAGSQFQNVEGFDLVCILNIDTADGTTPTLDADLQVFDPNGGEWVDTGDDFSQQNSTGQTRLEVQQPLGSQLRFNYTVGGTNPDFDFHMTVYKVPTLQN